MKKYLIVLVVILLSSCNLRERRLINEGEKIVSKIESFRDKNGYLPNSLNEVGEIESEYDDLHYEKRDSISYIISFGTSLGESKIYYSDTKKWEDFYR